MRRTIVLLDVMDTLVRDPFRDIPAFFGMESDTLWQLKHPDAWIRFEHGERSRDGFLDEFFADGRSFDHAAFESMIRDGYAFLPGIERLLAELAATQRTGALSVHALSNYPEWYVWIEDKLRLSRFLEWSFVSCLVGLRKPDPKLYEHVLRTLDAAPEDCLFVDDRQKNLDPAAALGMRTHLFQDANGLRDALVAEGILPAPTA